MSRIPPSLLYLTIYNPTLKPLLLDPDNEDAEEQAHILFYTAREHAVSRDRILRQVGLAKALVNFSEMFGSAVPCENVHSQARRMVMFSPEPDFWIHACYEVAKTPRQQPSGNKDSSKGKSKGKEKDQPAVVYDYHDGSVHDIALRTHFRRGYEDFKLMHGCFNFVLSRFGQQALELQLERFFTVWAWKWDIEDDDFGTQLGLPLHPLRTKLTPVLDKFASALPDEHMTFALMPPYLIPPGKPRYPASLVRHVLTRIPPPANPTPCTAPSNTSSSDQTQKATTSRDVKLAPQSTTGFPIPLSMPTMTMPSMNFGLDMKSVKWGWLTFGKGGAAKASSSPNASSNTSTPASLAAVVEGPKDAVASASEELQPHPGGDTLDVDSLLEAMTTESVGSYTRAASPAPSNLSRSSPMAESISQDGHITNGHIPSADTSKAPEEQQTNEPSVLEPEIIPSPSLPPFIEPTTRSIPSFLSFPAHLGCSGDPSNTRKQRVLHLSQGDITVAIVVDADHTLDLPHLANETVNLMDHLRAAVAEESRASDQQVLSAVKILQPKDRYIVSMDEYTVTSSAGFISRSEHLHSGQDLLRSGLDIHEVFSRGQNPQHWHVGRRGLGTTSDGRSIDGEVFFEVARKETTLTDVDNELVGVAKRYAEQV